jgi:hypothetical protein
MDKYLRALSRDDLTQWLIHFTKKKNNQPFDALRNILKIGEVSASTAEYITCYYPAGAACFSEVPPQNWPQLIDTNPSERKGFGIIVSKVVFWYLGGRPAIYTENPTAIDWPLRERFRLIKTELNKQPKPIDWTHEREWRFPGNLNLYHPKISYAWWWPCVEKIKEAQLIFREYNGIHTIYVMELGKVLERHEIIF